LKCGTWKCDTVLQGAESARLENARNDEYRKLNYKKYQYIFLNSDVGSSSNAVKAWHPCQIALRRTQQHTGMINTRVLSCWLVSYTGVGTHSNALCELEIKTQPRTDICMYVCNIYQMRQTHIKQQTQKAESEWRTVQSSKTKKNYKNYFTEWSWFGCGTLKRSDAAVAQPGEQAENCEVWCFIQTSRPTTCTCLVRPPKLRFVVRRTLTKYLHCSPAAVQPCSQSASWRWRAWPIARRVIGSTWCRSVQLSWVQFVCCEHGFIVGLSRDWKMMYK